MTWIVASDFMFLIVICLVYHPRIYIVSSLRPTLMLLLGLVPFIDGFNQIKMALLSSRNKQALGTNFHSFH